MQLNIKEPTITALNTFSVEITVMFGDADGYDTFEIGDFSSDYSELESLKYLLSVIEKVKNFKDRPDEYDEIKGFNRWFGTEIDDEYEALCQRDQDFHHEWANSYITNYEYGKYHDHQVYFTDKLGRKFKVEVTDLDNDEHMISIDENTQSALYPKI